MDEAFQWAGKIAMILILISVISWAVSRHYESILDEEKKVNDMHLRDRAHRLGIDMESVEDYMEYYGHDSKQMHALMLNPGVIRELTNNAKEAL